MREPKMKRLMLIACIVLVAGCETDTEKYQINYNSTEQLNKVMMTKELDACLANIDIGSEYYSSHGYAQCVIKSYNVAKLVRTEVPAIKL